MSRALAVMLYGFACAVLLAAFSMTPGMLKFVFSIGAFFLGLRFFNAHDTWGVRLAFIGTAVVLYFVCVVVYTILAYANGWPLPSAP